MKTDLEKLRKYRTDLLLLCIIRAYEHPERKSESHRLAEAREALFGETRSNGRTTTFDDLALYKIQRELEKPEFDKLMRALRWLQPEENLSDWDAEIEREPLSARSAAKKYSHLAGDGQNTMEDSPSDRLRRKARTPLTTKEMSVLSGLLDLDEPETRAIVRILELLETLGVRSETIWDKNT